MKKINIAVACHKESRLPSNPLFVPVQVNSANAKKRMNMAHDDEGDNISTKNPNYCELTAQYWEWKNVNADYYGLCHYRRFLCFTYPEDAKRNNRNHIEAEAIDDINIQRFGLEDAETMRAVIEANDVITGEYESIPKLYTPRGNQLTTYKHWAAHDRALIMVEDLERMLDILTDVSPEVGRDAREYLDKSFFTGFNCFILKKELFNELCSIEFEVLRRLEEFVDDKHYCTQLSRIYGFMGEIISSSYIYHLEKSGTYKVKHVPLLYFNNTDSSLLLEPINESVPVVFFNESMEFELFGAQWQSFLSCVSEDRKYDVIVVSRCNNKNLCDIYKKMCVNRNISLRFLNLNDIEKQICEHYLEPFYSKNKVKGEEQNLYLLPYLPYFLLNYKEALVFTNNSLFVKDVYELWEYDLNGAIIAAPLDILMIARVNDIYPETEYIYLKEQVKDPYEYYSVNAFKINLDGFRTTMSLDNVVQLSVNCNKQKRNGQEIINILCQGRVIEVSQRWNVIYETSEYLKYQIPYAPLSLYQEQQKARNDPAIIAYIEHDIYSLEVNPLTLAFWGNAEKTPLINWYMVHCAQKQAVEKKRSIDITEKLFPKGTARHAIMTHLFPKDSARFKAIKKILSYFNME